VVGKYAGVLWPLRLNSRGDFDKGFQREVLRSDIRAVLQTRRFLDLRRGGERVMRPGAYGLVPILLFDVFDPDVLVPLVETWVEEAMDWLVRAGKLSVQRILVSPFYDPARLNIKIDYLVLEENVRDTFETEIQSFTPVDSSSLRRA
jgi:hypothetical protein